jgi:hypothetical protein
MTEQIFVRNNRKGATLDDADESNLDILVVVGGGTRFAVLHFVNDEVGTADSDPKGSGCGLSFGSVGKIGGVLTVEQFLVFDSVQHAPIAPGKAAGILTLARDSAALDSSMFDGSYKLLQKDDRLPKALRQYTDKLGEADRTFRINYPF